MSFSAHAIADDTKRIAIPAGDLRQALLKLSKEYSAELVYQPSEVTPYRTRGVSGTYSARDAVRLLLKGTPLELRVDPSGAMAVVPAHTDTTSTNQSSPAQDEKEGKKSSSEGFRMAQANAGQTAGAPALGVESQQPETKPVELQEIIVTAQKRSESIQDVPLSMNAISAERLNAFNYTQLSDYAATIPGLQVDSGGSPGFHTVTIRGVSTGNQYGSTTTAVYVDDVPVGPSGSYSYGASFDGIDLLPYDLDHVEVLKGPQGTLYGASSLGGLLKYVLSTPDLERNSFHAGGDFSGIDGGHGVGYGFRAAANVPVVPSDVALSLSAAHTYTPGYITNIQNGDSGINHGIQDGGRVALLWKPVDQLTIRLSALLNHSDWENVSQIPLDANGQPLYGKFEARYFFRNGIKINDRLYSADIAYDFGWSTLTSVTGYFDANSNLPEDADIYQFLTTLGGGSLVPAVDDLSLKKFSQEFRLASRSTARFQWLLGAFYTHESPTLYEEINVLNPVTLQPNPVFNPLEDLIRSSTFKEKAVYANGTYAFTNQWDLNAGIRYSHNDQTVSNTNSGVVGPTYGSSDKSTTYSVSSRYHFDPNAMVYGRVATGYRPGGSNIGLPGAPATFAPDKVTNYEGGFKSELFDKRFLLNAAAFYIDWKDIQLAQFTNTKPPLIYTGNGGSAVSYGGELTTEFAVTDQLRVGANVVFDNAKLTADAPAVGGLNGDRLPLSPQWSGSVTGDWAHPLTNSYSFTAGAVWRYVGDRNTDFPPGLGNAGGSNYLRLTSYNTVDLSMGLTSSRLTARLYAKNVGNTYTFIRYYAPMATLLQPRTIGLSVDLMF